MARLLKPHATAVSAKIEIAPVALTGGLDIVSPPLTARPGTLRMAVNYEAAIGGGYEGIGGFERFDGRFSPSEADYVYVECTANTTAVVGNTITGATSGATGVCFFVDGRKLAMTKITGTFAAAEVLRVSGTPVGTVATLEPEIDGFRDNELAAGAADVYRADIAAVPGFSRIRGLAILGTTVYAWRDNVAITAMNLFKSTSTGWQQVTLHHQVSFTGGSVAPTEGGTIAQSGVSATVKRVVLESGDWTTSNAAGRLIVTAPSGGVFAAGALTSGGTLTLAGASAQIALAVAGRVQTDRYSFTARLEDQRLYGCDGVNPEFELGPDDVYVPLNTGMGSVRALAVKCHKNHLFFGYRGSLQHSGIGEPYKWSVIFGAAELGTGDVVTNLVSVGGSESAAALMILCQNAVWTLYGNSSADWNLVNLSRVQGARPYSGHDIGGVVAIDQPGFVRYPAADSFGNFVWDTVSQQIEPIARGQVPQCSVFVANRSKWRVFFGDGTAVSGNASANGQFEWTTIDYGLNIVLAEHAEIDGVPRTFYAADNGFVYEADVGRSFDGVEADRAMRLTELFQKSPVTIKQYRRIELEAHTKSACRFSVGAEFDDGEEESDPLEAVQTSHGGAGLYYDTRNFDEAYYDVTGIARKRFTFEGFGTHVSPIFVSRSKTELPHTIRSLTLFFTPRRLGR